METICIEIYSPIRGEDYKRIYNVEFAQHAREYLDFAQRAKEYIEIAQHARDLTERPTTCKEYVEFAHVREYRVYNLHNMQRNL